MAHLYHSHLFILITITNWLDVYDSSYQFVRHRDHFVNMPSQWEMTLCNVISHWLGTYTKWSLETPMVPSHYLKQISSIISKTSKIFSKFSRWYFQNSDTFIKKKCSCSLILLPAWSGNSWADAKNWLSDVLSRNKTSLHAVCFIMTSWH